MLLSVYVYMPTLFAPDLVISNSTSTHLVWLQRDLRDRKYMTVTITDLSARDETLAPFDPKITPLT